MPPKRQKKRNPNRGQPRRRIPRRIPLIEHFWSVIQTVLTLKKVHKKEEVYPLALSSLISRANGGADADIRMIGYSISLQLATGNHTETVTANIGHSGPWIRRGSSTDTFNQQFLDHTFKNNRVLFKKKLLHSAEREYVNPDTDDNFIFLRVRDPCGIVPSCSVKIEFRAHLIRPMPQTVLVGADTAAVDIYEDQDVDPNGTPQPPGVQDADVPSVIKVPFGNNLVTSDSTSPLTYTNGSTTVKVTVLNAVNKVGLLIYNNTAEFTTGLQAIYSANGYDGTIERI